MVPFLLAVIKVAAFDPMVTKISLVIILVLVILLTFKELARSMDHPRWKRWLRELGLLIVPLLFYFGIIILVRLLSL